MTAMSVALDTHRLAKTWLAVRWSEILEEYHDFFENRPERIETDAYGNLLMSPPPGMHHQRQADWICQTLQFQLPEAQVYQGLAVLTDSGVKIPDVLAVLSDRPGMQDTQPFDPAPEICIEVISPSNSAAEIAEKQAIYLAAGAQEVWVCDRNNRMTFFDRSGQLEQSALCAEFPLQLDLSQPPIAQLREVNAESDRKRRLAEDRLLASYDRRVTTPEDRKRLETEDPELVADHDRIISERKSALRQSAS
jgi:Uma2 family endonuclease